MSDRLEAAQHGFVFISTFCLVLAALTIDEGWVSVILALIGLAFGWLSLVAKRLQNNIVI